MDNRTSEESTAGPVKGVKTEAIAHKKSRRVFVHAVSVVVPTILTVGARSTLAATCLSPSATASINLLHSRPDRPSDQVCAGRSPERWKDSRNNEQAKTILFSQVFAGGFHEKTMHDALSFSGNGNFKPLARHLAAAWLNLQAQMVSSNVLSLADLQAMWAGRNGTYAPVAGGSVTWGESQIIDYLKTTMS